MKDCSDFPHFHHCVSCHEDEAEGYEMLHVILPNGEEAYVCCSLAIIFEAQEKENNG